MKAPGTVGLSSVNDSVSKMEGQSIWDLLSTPRTTLSSLTSRTGILLSLDPLLDDVAAVSTMKGEQRFRQGNEGWKKIHPGPASWIWMIVREFVARRRLLYHRCK